jgi:hypothetical protein
MITGALTAGRVPAASDQRLQLGDPPPPVLPFYDVRDGAATPPASAPPTTREARTALRTALGRQGVLDIDPRTGTPRALGRLDGALTAPRKGSARTIALDYVRAYATAIGLDSGDLQQLQAAGGETSPDGVTHLRWRQTWQGIPAYDNELRVNVARDGRVVSVLGSPQHALAAQTTGPTITAAAALQALMDNVGVRRQVTVVRSAGGPQQPTTFADGDRASLVLFGMGPGVARLAWHVTYRATSRAWYDAVVDAQTGRILRRANLVEDFAPAAVWEKYPGAAVGGTAHPADLGPYLTDLIPTRLFGPNAHVWADVNDNNAVDPGEEIAPTAAKGFALPFVDFTATNPGGGCLPTAQCSWKSTTPSSWKRNLHQAAVQAFYYVNKYHDHLAAAPIGFDDASGSFDGTDRLNVQTDDGAATAGGIPDLNHVDNGNMATPPDGESPVMQLYLFMHAEPLSPYRDINGADDAVTVYHEYTHGLSSRLVTDAQGSQALNSPQSGAMGEGWSDWYAEDFLVDEFPQQDTPADGDIDVGAYTDADPGETRTQPMDCPVGSTSPRCPGTPGVGPGGYTYGDFGRIGGRPEVHSDGEIWGETLWDLRTAIGSTAAERLITEGMRLAPPEPSFLDMRNAILQADSADATSPGRYHSVIWSVFAHRGMGFFAGTDDATDTSPVEDFSLPPAGDGPAGTVTGQVTSAETGLPLSGVQVSLGGHGTDPGFADSLSATTDVGGYYRIDGVPAGIYPKLVFAAGGGFDRETRRAVQVDGGSTVTIDAAVRRDWAATGGGAKVVDTNGDKYASLGCGTGALVDQSLGTGWSTENVSPGVDDPTPGDRSVTIELPATIDVTAFGMDPGNACGDGASAATRGYLVETSSDGITFTAAARGQFTPDDAHRLNLVTPAAGAHGVRFVRLTLLSAQREDPGASGSQFIDFSELEVLGSTPDAPPAGSLVASPTKVQAGGVVHFNASSMRDPDSTITGYEWDFDGDGTTDLKTLGPTIDHTYRTPGTYRPRVVARDFQGTGGEASTSIQVTGTANRGTGSHTDESNATASAAIAARGHGDGITARVHCAMRCVVAGRLVVTRTTAKRMRLRTTTIGVARATLPHAQRRTIRITVTPAARRALARLRQVQASVLLTIRPLTGHGATRTTIARRAVTIAR